MTDTCVKTTLQWLFLHFAEDAAIRIKLNVTILHQTWFKEWVNLLTSATQVVVHMAVLVWQSIIYSNYFYHLKERLQNIQFSF